MLSVARVPKLPVLVLLLLATAALLPGCATTYRAPRLTKTPLEDKEKIVYKDGSLRRNLAVMDIVQDEVNGMLHVRAKVKNNGRGMINAEVKIKFIDQSGMEIGQGAPWTPLPVEGGEIRNFEGLAASKQAVDWRILVQVAGSH